jgi:uncharacterized protein
MSALARQLEQLRRQAGQGAPATRPTPPQASSLAGNTRPIGAPSPGAREVSAEDMVARLRKLLSVRAPLPLAPVAARDRNVPGDEIAPGLRYLEQWTPWSRGPEVLALDGIGQGEVARSRVLAFDTETTGLAGGTGTRAFMIGAADWRDGGLRVRQLTITALAAEHAMLHAFAGWLEADTVLLSYNGKSYDRPLLSTRYRLARLADPLCERRHIDLLHPVRRRYRGVWANCRLGTVERELLGVLREDDLPGSEAPGAWLDYLRGGSADKLRRVGLHNAQDVRNLCRLLEAMQDPADGFSR